MESKEFLNKSLETYEAIGEFIENIMKVQNEIEHLDTAKAVKDRAHTTRVFCHAISSELHRLKQVNQIIYNQMFSKENNHEQA